MNPIYTRIFLFFGAYFMLVTFPWWFSVLVLFFLTVYFNFYLEVLFFGFIFDNIYSQGQTFFHTGLLSATILLALSVYLKNKVRR